MNETFFEKALLADSSITSKSKAVSTRLSKARSVEEKISVNLEEVVYDDKKMYQLLLEINNRMNNSNGAYSNTVRKYYLYRRGKEFPSLNQFKRLS